MKYITLHQTESDFQSAKYTFDLPNVALTEDDEMVHFVTETMVAATFSGSGSILIYTYYDEGTAEENVIGTEVFDKIIVDGVEQSISNLDANEGMYTFSTDGVHIVKYQFKDSTTIFREVFWGCESLTSIFIPDSVTSIGNSAFNDCTYLTAVTIGKKVTTIGTSAFTGCDRIKELTIPNSVTSIGDSAFRNCNKLSSVTIGNSVTSIGASAFRGDSVLASITCLGSTSPTITSTTFQNVKTGGTLYVPSSSDGYLEWMLLSNYYLGKYSWTKVEQ